jgi:hypothetical protein
MEQSSGVGKLHGLGLCFGYFVNTCMAGPSEKDVSPSLSLSLLFIVELIKLSHRISPHSYHGFLFPWVERACLQNDQAVRN